MWVPRQLLIVLFILLGAAVFAERAQGQQAYEFGIRFNPVNFRPVIFNRFSFRQPSFRGLNTQPIQFDRINFPALNSRTVRRAASRGNIRPESNQPDFDVNDGRRRERLQIISRRLAVSSRNSREQGTIRQRLVLRSPTQADEAGVRGGELNRPTYPIATRSPYSRQSVNSYARARSSYYRSPFAVAATTLSQAEPASARREIVSHRRGRKLSSGVRTARLSTDRIAVRSASRLRLGELSSRTLR